MKIEQVATSALIPYARNSKKHGKDQIEQIAASIREYGFNNPVLIDDSGTIIAGHGRTAAAQLLGMEKVPCIRLKHLTDKQRRAYIIADNRLSETGGGWDLEMLSLELAEIGSELPGVDADFLAEIDKLGYTLPEDVTAAEPGEARQDGLQTVYFILDSETYHRYKQARGDLTDNEWLLSVLGD